MPRFRVSAAAALAVLSLGAGTGAPTVAARHPALRTKALGADRAAAASAAPPCAAHTLPDGEACVRLPDVDGPPESEQTANGHHDARGRWIVYDEIGRHPERPADYDAYRYPVACDHDCVSSGYDLDRPEDMQRHEQIPGALGIGPSIDRTVVGHGAVDLPQRRGTRVDMLALEHQEGDAEVIYLGTLFGTTVITRHSLREDGQLRDYLLIFGHLESEAPGLRVGLRLRDRDPVGFVGDSGTVGLTHLHLEARRVRPGIDVVRLAAARMVANDASVVCDPRNVLPLRRSP